MGLSRHIWRPPLTYDDLEFQGGQLAKVRGIRPYQMDGYQLKATLEQVAIILFKAVEGSEARDKIASFAHLEKAVEEAGEPPVFKWPEREWITHTDHRVRHTSHGMLYAQQPSYGPDADPGGPEAPDSGGCDGD